MSREPAPERRIRKERRDVAERRARNTDEGEQAGLQDIVGAGSPVFLVDALEDRERVLGSEMWIFIGAQRERIHSDGMSFLVGSDVENIAQALARNSPERIADEITLRIEHGAAAAGGDVLPDEVQQQRRLPGPGRPEDVKMVPRG